VTSWTSKSSVQALRKVGSKPMKARSRLNDCSERVSW
jgi:hypothetical protein